MKKKILFINGHLNTGGVEKALVDILRHLDYEKYEVDLLLLEDLGDYAPELPKQVDVRLLSLKNTFGSVPSTLLRCFRQNDWFSFRMRLIFVLMKLFGQKQIRLAKNMLTGAKHYHCVIGFRPGICTQIAAFATNADRRITWWHHGSLNVNSRDYFEYASTCHKIVVVSNACRNMLEDAFPTLSHNLVTIPNLIDVEMITQKCSCPPPYNKSVPLHLVSVGRLAPEKHFENAIYTAANLKARGLCFQWHLLGDGPERSALEQLAATLDVMDCFTFEGNQSNPYPYIKHANLFVHPSYIESFGIVILEAMALGIPCVVTKSLGPCDFIEDGVNGLLTEQSPESLTEKVVHILSGQKLYLQIKGNTYCPSHFLPKGVIHQIDQILEESQ